MKLSKRELIMLTVLLIIGLFFVEYRLILTPGIERFMSITEELATLEYEYQTINMNLMQAESLEKRRDENLVEIETLAEPFLNGVTKDALLVFTHSMMTKHGFTLESYSPSPKDSELLQPEQIEIQALNYRIKELALAYRALSGDTSGATGGQSSADTGGETVVELFSLQIRTVGSYDQIKAMLDDFDSLAKWIIVTNINMTPEQQENNQLFVSFVLNYYGIEKLTGDADPLNEWTREAMQASEQDPFFAQGVTPTPSPTPPAA